MKTLFSVLMLIFLVVICILQITLNNYALTVTLLWAYIAIKTLSEIIKLIKQKQ